MVGILSEKGSMHCVGKTDTRLFLSRSSLCHIPLSLLLMPAAMKSRRDLDAERSKK